jgi:hypothetical protein
MYTFNPEMAKAGFSVGGSISETGAYEGAVTQAYEVISAEKKTKGVRFDFKSPQGSASFTLWTAKADGSAIRMGLAQLYAIMACMKVREAILVNGTAKVWKNGGLVDKPADMLPSLIKPVGVLFNTESYIKKDGSIGKRVVIAGCFVPGSRFSAREVLSQATEAVDIDRMIKALRHKDFIQHAPRATALSANLNMPSSASWHDDMDSEIPF